MNQNKSTTLDNVMELDVADAISGNDLETLNPHVAEAIRSIQAERAGVAPIAWSEFSSHTKK